MSKSLMLIILTLAFMFTVSCTSMPGFQNAELSIMIYPGTDIQKAEGESIAFSVVVSGGSGQYSIQWVKDGATLHQTGATLTLTNLKESDAGFYWAVVVDNRTSASKNSPVAQLTVGSNEPPVPPPVDVFDATGHWRGSAVVTYSIFGIVGTHFESNVPINVTQNPNEPHRVQATALIDGRHYTLNGTIFKRNGLWCADLSNYNINIPILGGNMTVIVRLQQAVSGALPRVFTGTIEISQDSLLGQSIIAASGSVTIARLP